MFCPKCGSLNEDTSNFCAKCSNPLIQAAAAAQQNQPSQQYAPPTAPINPAPKKKHTLRNVVMIFAVLVIVFFIWAAFSPDDVPKETTGDPGETTSELTTPEETTATGLIVIDTAEQAVTLIQQFTVDTSWELLYEENFIDNRDGTLAIEVNNPDNATVPCFVIQPVGGSDAGGYSGYYIVRKGTNEIYQHQDMNSSNLVKVSG